MDKNFYWGFMIKLSTHMWDDETTPPRGWYLPQYYTETNNVDVEVWDETIKYLGDHKFNMLLVDVGDGIKYESHPEISAPDAWDKDFLKKKLDEARALGITPIPKLNFSCGHDTWLKEYRRMISTKIYYQVCADLIKEVCEAFGNPPLFHLGFDEEMPGHQTTHEMITVRGEKLWWNDLNFLAAECEKHGARPWIWSDYIWHHKDLFLKHMSKEILQSNWYYDMFKAFAPDARNARNNMYIETYELLDKLGYDQIPTCSSWSNIYNNRQTIAYCKDKLSEEHLKGILVAPWLWTTRDNAHGLLCDAERFYFGRKEFWPESL